jgi:hypothetical protein
LDRSHLVKQFLRDFFFGNSVEVYPLLVEGLTLQGVRLESFRL